MYPGAGHSGEVVIAQIGIPEMLDEDKDFNTYLITEHYAHVSIPFRTDDSHKGAFGKVFNIAGSFEMPGAAYMCAKSSLLVGAGYSTLATPRSVVPVVAGKASEIVYKTLTETEDWGISENALTKALEASAGSGIVLMGPGLGTDDSTVKFVSQFVEQVTGRGDKLLLDGDALNALAMQKDFALPLESVITPHPKELSRLMNVSVEDILKDRLGSAREAACKHNTIVVLKGANTVIAEPDGDVYINITGNSGLATAGSGDVLAGMIAGFVAQDLELRDAAILGVYLHGLAADIAVEELNEYSLTATNLMDYLPDAINKVLEY